MFTFPKSCQYLHQGWPETISDIKANDFILCTFQTLHTLADEKKSGQTTYASQLRAIKCSVIEFHPQ